VNLCIRLHLLNPYRRAREIPLLEEVSRVRMTEYLKLSLVVSGGPVLPLPRALEILMLATRPAISAGFTLLVKNLPTLFL